MTMAEVTQESSSMSGPVVIAANTSRRIFTRSKVAHQIPDEILNNVELQKDISRLPDNYNFEIPKTIWKIKSNNFKCAALQFPEGFLMYANTIADIIEKYTDAVVILMGDVTYGACCVDDFTALALGAELLVHYGHSCLVPINVTSRLQLLYIFVDIKIDSLHFVESVRYNFEAGAQLGLVSTIQFVTTLQSVSKELEKEFKIVIPQCKPLSPGEILGCTSPKLDKNTQAIIYLGDGRFHLESIMIANPDIPAYRYDPYSKIFSKESYDFTRMHKNRSAAIATASDARVFGVILGTLGRQGSPKVLETVCELIEKQNKDYVIVMIPEVSPDELRLYDDIDAWIQVACPRLSIDWGTTFDKPLLTPYEAFVCLKAIEYQSQYPMDYYSNDSLGPWTVNNLAHRPERPKKTVGSANISAAEKSLS